MARRKTLAQQEREVDYARAREAYRRRTDIPLKAYSGPRPIQVHAYRSLFLRGGSGFAESVLVRVPASELAITKIGLARLNISTADNFLEQAIDSPQGFLPSIMRASSNRTGDPLNVTAYGGTGRPYRKYTATSSRAEKANSSAPVCVPITTTTPTLALLRTTINGISADKEAIVGVNGGSLSYALESIREYEF